MGRLSARTVTLTDRSRGQWGGTIEAWHDSTRVGFAEYAPDGWIENIEVTPEWRRQRIATQMAAAVRDAVGAMMPGEGVTPDGIAWVAFMDTVEISA